MMLKRWLFPAGSSSGAGAFPRDVNREAQLGGTGAKRIRTESPTRPDSGFVLHKILYLKGD
jgi:hypothetical protein